MNDMKELKKDYSQRMAASIIYDSLCECTSEENAISRTELQNLLNTNYGFKIERKALSRHLNTLFISEIGVIITDDNKIYYDATENMALSKNHQRSFIN